MSLGYEIDTSRECVEKRRKNRQMSDGCRDSMPDPTPSDCRDVKPLGTCLDRDVSSKGRIGDDTGMTLLAWRDRLHSLEIASVHVAVDQVPDWKKWELWMDIYETAKKLRLLLQTAE